jgi:hypothetical protein
VVVPGLITTMPRSTSSRFGAAEQQTDVLARLALVEQLAEHLHTGDRGGLLGLADPTMSTVSLTLTTPRSIGR